jgi:hypothetical protein
VKPRLLSGAAKVYPRWVAAIVSLRSAWLRTDSSPRTRKEIPSRFASKPQYSTASVVNIQLPPLGLVTPITLPFNSAGFLIFGDAMMLPMSLLIMPATNTRSVPSAAEPRTAPVTEPS